MGEHIAQCDTDTTYKKRVGHVSIVKPHQRLAICTFVIYCLLEVGDSTIDYFVTVAFVTANAS